MAGIGFGSMAWPDATAGVSREIGTAARVEGPRLMLHGWCQRFLLAPDVHAMLPARNPARTSEDLKSEPFPDLAPPRFGRRVLSAMA